MLYACTWKYNRLTLQQCIVTAYLTLYEKKIPVVAARKPNVPITIFTIKVKIVYEDYVVYYLLHGGPFFVQLKYLIWGLD